MSTLQVLVILNLFKIAHIQIINQRYMEHSVNDSFTIRLAIILKNDLIDTLKLFQI